METVLENGWEYHVKSFMKLIVLLSCLDFYYPVKKRRSATGFAEKWYPLLLEEMLNKKPLLVGSYLKSTTSIKEGEKLL